MRVALTDTHQSSPGRGPTAWIPPPGSTVRRTACCVTPGMRACSSAMGDMADDAAPEAYAGLMTRLARVAMPVRLIIGNPAHDVRPVEVVRHGASRQRSYDTASARSAGRSTFPSAVRGSAVTVTTWCGCLKRASLPSKWRSTDSGS